MCSGESLCECFPEEGTCVLKHKGGGVDEEMQKMLQSDGTTCTKAVWLKGA